MATAMRMALRRRRVAWLVLAPALAGCAAIFGMEEATVRSESAGGGDSSPSSSSGAGLATTAGSQGGAGGDGGCRDAGNCGDDNPCTVDTCDDGVCRHQPDGAADPPDPNPPCTTAVCVDGEPQEEIAEEGTPCGDGLTCDGEGACPCETDLQCGAPTECGSPFCGRDRTCDPGLAAAGSPVEDPDGNCVDLACDGASATAVEVPSPSDEPLDPTCGDAVCQGTLPMVVERAEGTPCAVRGVEGYCSGAIGDAECNVCTRDRHCEESDEGAVCFSDEERCGCEADADCTSAASFGRQCRDDIGGSCGCEGNGDCVVNWRGGTCGVSDRCVCTGGSECVASGYGSRCLSQQGADVCGCATDDDCGGAAVGPTCNLDTNRCE